MQDKISFTIPMERGVLLKTADYLKKLADVGDVMADPSEDTVEALGDRLDAAVAAGAQSGAIVSVKVGGTESELMELDAEGLPWDARIHSSGKSKLKDGTWRLKGGVDPALVETVKVELRAKWATAPETETPPGDPAVFATPPAEETPPPPAGPPAPETEPSVPTPTEPPVNATAPADLPQNYGALVSFITAAGKKLAPFDIVDACKQSGAAVAIGVTNLPELAKAGDDGIPYIPLIAEALRKIWAARA